MSATPTPQAWVVFESMFGNTQQVGHAVARGLVMEGIAAEVVDVGSFPPSAPGRPGAAGRRSPHARVLAEQAQHPCRRRPFWRRPGTGQGRPPRVARPLPHRPGAAAAGDLRHQGEQGRAGCRWPRLPPPAGWGAAWASRCSTGRRTSRRRRPGPVGGRGARARGRLGTPARRAQPGSRVCCRPDVPLASSRRY